jgi:hypothetical protein
MGIFVGLLLVTFVHFMASGDFRKTNDRQNQPWLFAVGAQHQCEIINKDIICTGNNSQGQLNAPLVRNPIQIVAGDFHTCVLDGNRVRCWGNNHFGQLNVPQLNGPKQIFAEDFTSCALDLNGMRCWGRRDPGSRFQNYFR